MVNAVLQSPHAVTIQVPASAGVPWPHLCWGQDEALGELESASWEDKAPQKARCFLCHTKRSEDTLPMTSADHHPIPMTSADHHPTAMTSADHHSTTTRRA